MEMGMSLSPYGVIVLYNQTTHLVKGEPHDMLAETGVIVCAQKVAEALQDHFRVVQVPIHSDVELALAPYPPSEWVVFNLGEGIEGRLFECARIAWALEAMGYTFTGSSGNSIAITTHKALTKQLLSQAGIRTPEGWIIRDSSDLRNHMPFPLIVKPIAEDGSLGIESQAVVNDFPSLKERVEFITQIYRQAALVEDFIVGREFNISVWGNPPEVLPLDEIDFRDFDDPYQRIVSFAAKWDSHSFEYHHTPGICPAQVSDDVRENIIQTALTAWHTLGCNGYARMDMRLDAQKRLFVIEVNCNPDLSPDAGFFRAAQAAGYTYQEMILKILQLSLQ